MSFIKKSVEKANSIKSNMGRTIKKNYVTSGTTLLHGHLLIEVIAAKNLPDMESWLAKLVDKKDVTDPFVDVRLGKAKLAKTTIIDNDLNPEWNESYRVEVCHFADHLVFEVRDKDHAYSEYIGAVDIPTSSLLTGQDKQGWFPICKSNGRPHGKAELNIRIKFISKHTLEQTYEVDCYFPMRRNCLVTLYQDAHALDIEQMPQFKLLGQQMSHLPLDQVTPRSCWKDLYHTLMEAQHIICITGWAVWHAIKLFRGADLSIDSRTLGEILIEKAQKGVKVYVMVWSEKTSGDFVGEKGVMGTHDMETFNYFKNTQVSCALAPREISVNEFTDALQNQFSSGCYTHHQKSIIADAAGPTHRRRLVAFVGGLDLTGGRYDTPNHELYSTLLTEHENDFRNSNAKSVPPTQGPREPWHDIHSRVEGPIAHDVFLNFQERWSKQGKRYGNLNDIEAAVIDIDCPPPIQDPSKQWNVQLFRSITSDSADFHQHMSDHLNSKKGRMVDSSIAQAYVQMIRNAENFIYIENQYFLGSAYCWTEKEDVNCHHTIPSEIAQKVVDKIHQNQRFTAYILIPMFPEGDPASAPIQEILFWQFKTMEMMYQRVGEALKQTGSSTHPTDWLLFLCPGKREAGGQHLDRLEDADESMAKIFRKSLRFPIYVHSKMMIIDDAYIIVGSANINQRSLAGTRDTEMAVGCWQPNFHRLNPYGDVHKFRMSLWTEHFRHMEQAFIHPGSIECVQKVKQYASHNWQMYTGPQGSTTPGQLLPYPIDVMADGELRNLDGIETFPDFPPGSKIMGTVSSFIPQKVTT
jgi:phospholipase D1/2